MGIKWSDIKFGLSPLSNKVYMGKAKDVGNGVLKMTDKSGDITCQCLQIVKMHLEERCKTEEKFKDGIDINFANGVLSFIPNKEGES